MKGQLKIQEMAFVLVAILIFFVLVVLIFVSIRSASLSDSAQELKEDRAREAIRKISETPEFTWSDCSSCIDLDKVFVLKQQMRNQSKVYEDLWNFDYLSLETTYPAREGGECLAANYPNCNKLTLIEKENYGVTSAAFITICHWESNPGYTKCELGRIYASGK